MTETSQKILESFQIRKSKGQKEEFRRWFSGELQKAGSAAFAKAHPGAKSSKPVLNFDCVGEGASVQCFPNPSAKKDDRLLNGLESAVLPEEGKTVEVVRSFGFYPSDQRHFRRGIGICALQKHRIFGYYMDKIHTGKDTVLDEGNIRLLRDGVERLLRMGVQ